MPKSKKPKNNHERPTNLYFFVQHVYLPDAKIRKKSWRRDESIFEHHIAPRFGEKRLDDIKSWEVREWQNDLRESGLAPSSCNYFLAVFKTIYSIAESNGAIPTGMSPCRKVRPFKLREAW